MWWRLKFVVSGLVLLVTLVWVIEDLFHHLGWQALGTLAAGILAALGTLAINEENAPWLVLPIAGIFSIAGWLHVGNETPALNVQRQLGLQALFETFSNSLGTPGLSQAEQDLVWKGMANCAAQPTRDQLATTMEAMKARYETPLMSMVDRATSAGNSSPSPDQCIEAYRDLRPQMPGMFVQAEKQNPWLLEQLQPQ
jgi:hypothetical protein